MTKLATLAIAISVLFGASAVAQSSFVMGTGTLLSACPTVPATGSKLIAVCNVSGDPSNPDGLYIAPAGGFYFQVAPQGSGAVSSVFGRKGAVVAQPGDYTWAQIGTPPTTLTCTSFSFTNTGITASGCTLK